MNNNFNITVLTKDLIHVLNFATGIVDKRTVKPILGNVKLEAIENNLMLTATSPDISLKMSIGADVRSEGATTVNILTFSDIVRKLSDESINLTYNQETEQIEVKGHKFNSHLSTLPSSEFPTLDNIHKTSEFEVSAKSLLRIISQTEFAMSTEETRYNLNGIYLNSTGNKAINATALDGHRLATSSEPVAIKNEFGLILPKKTVFELIKILKDTHYTEQQVTVSFDSNRISFAIGNLQIISKLIDASFPDYTSLIPELSENKLVIHSKLLSNVVDRVATITQDKYKAIKFAVSTKMIEISAFGESKGSAKEEITNSDDDQKFLFEGTSITIGFNPKYLLDILKNLDDHEIEIFFTNSSQPLLVRPLLYTEDRHIIMPMNV